jgi:hypothetical protein
LRLIWDGEGAGVWSRIIDALAAAHDAAVQHDPSGRPVLKPQPVHDWTSHAADAFRYLALTLDRRVSVTGFNRRLDYVGPQGIV